MQSTCRFYNHSATTTCLRYGKECEYQQPFMPDGARLCINCTKPVPGKAAAQPADAILDGMTLLFCRWAGHDGWAGRAWR